VPGYTTIAAGATAELEVKRSRFLAILEPVADEEQARAVIARVRAEHPRARHHCTAFVLGARQDVQRTNDDGEPSGTAGAPMLEALLAAGLSDVVAVVVRYFGGVLLGAAGLTRAYRAAVAEAVAVAQPRVRELRVRFRVVTGYAEVALIEAEAHRRQWTFSGDYAGEVSTELAVPVGEVDLLFARLAELTAGRARPEPLGDVWVDR
jgi:uncharacterized YigZ family protein